MLGEGRALPRPPLQTRSESRILIVLPLEGLHMSMKSAGVGTPAAARRFLDGRPKRLFIGGEWVEAADGRTFSTPDPATGEALAEVAFAGTEDVDRAVRAARRAFDEGPWAGSAPREREAALRRIAELIDANAQELATLEVLDSGKPLRRALGEMASVAECFRYYAGWPTKINGTLLPSAPHLHKYVRREAVGVCGQIIPWNFPLIAVGWKVAPALACGNVIVLKPAEQTPLTALRFAELTLEAGIPAGVVNVLTGDGTTGAALVAHPLVDKIAFTGSTEVGKKVMAAAAGTVKRVSLELGGKSPNIVFADADLDLAAKGSMMGVFGNSGQVCSAGTRLFLEATVHDDFVERLSTFTRSLKVGPGIEEGVHLGPVVSEEQFDRVTGYLEAGSAEGATAVLGGRAMERAGYFVEPTIFTGVTSGMRIAREEIFGPVLSVIPFDGVEEAVAMGNDTVYGLAAGLWTRDLSKAHRVAAGLRAGTVWVNCYGEFDVNTPFGGYKQSGFGRELGEAALDLYTQQKSVVIRI